METGTESSATALPDAECVAFLKWAMPRMGFRWAGFRRVRRQVRRRLRGRLRELGFGGLEEYRSYLAREPGEWRRLEELCHITVSRFYRDRRVFRTLGSKVLPRLAQRARAHQRDLLRIWSAGCGAGEEPFSLAILWRQDLAVRLATRLEIVATDADEHQLERARLAEYRASSLREVPDAWREAAFEQVGEDRHRLLPPYRQAVEFVRQDLRRDSLPGAFDLVLCRNLAFTYFDDHQQRLVLRRLCDALQPAGALVIGGHERLPDDHGLQLVEEERCIYRLPD